MSRIGWLALLVCLAAHTVVAQETAPAAEGQAAGAATQSAEQQPAEGQQPAQQSSAEQPAGPNAEAVAARQAFDALHRQWQEVIKQITAVQEQRRAAQGDQRAELDKQVAELYKQADELIGQISESGLAVYKADPKAYEDVNDTLLAIARFHLTGGPTGDGGDQYEKAIKLVKGLIDAGAGDQWPQLYLWGAISAYCTNDFGLAEQYFAKWGASGGDPGLPQNLMESAAQYQQSLPTMKRAWEKESQLREAEAKADDLPRVKLTTTKGDIVLEMFENEAPQSVANFITLAKQGFYNGVPFHRVLPGFMAQGGDPTGTGAGGPGYNIKDEQRLPNARKHFRGVLSMANTGQPNSGGSQFFLTFVPTSFLDGRHAVFGRVIEGMDVAAAIKRRDPDSPVGQPDKIIKAEVLRDRGHEYKFEKFPE